MVEWKKLTKVSYVQYGYPFDSSLFSEDNSYIPLIRIRDVKPGIPSTYYTGDYSSDYIIQRGDILVGMDGEFNLAKWQSRDGLLNQRVLKLSGKDGTCISGYLYHYMGPVFKRIEKQTAGGSVKHLSAKVINNLVIPIPTLSEQNCIVGILDTFTDSIENLKQQIAQRRKQYEFYRDQLLDNISISTKIGELTKVFSCPRVYKNQWQDSGIPFWRSSDVMSYYNGVKNPRGEVFISQSLYDKLLQKSEKIEKGDILVTGGGSIGIPYLKKDNKPLFVKDADLICIKKCESIIPSFLYHFFFSTSFRLYLKKITHDATIAHYTISQIIETPIPVPPLSEQQRIVSILDTFEASISNLEAQLAQRQKQYEYYRNKLLTFE